MKKDNNSLKKLVNLILEARILKYIFRASYHYLKGPIRENIAEHSFYTILISWILAKKENKDENKIIKMAILHDLIEVRTGEKNLINKFYNCPTNDLKVIKEICKNNSLNEFHFEKLFQEYFEGKTKEAKIVKDADILSEMLLEKECFDLGNKKAKKWLDVSLSRLKTKTGKELGKKLKTIDGDKWWVEIAEKYILKTKFL